MSAHDDHAGEFGDALAELVNDGKINDLEALAYLSGQPSERIDRMLEDREESRKYDPKWDYDDTSDWK